MSEGEELERANRKLKEALETIASLETSHRELFNNATHAVVIVDQERVIRFANPAAEAIFRCRAGDLLGEAFGFPVVAGGKTEISIDHDDGGTTTAEMRVSEMNWEGENAYRVLIHNMVGRRLIEKSLKESEEKYKTLTDHLNVGVYRNTPGPRGRFIEMNPAHVSMFGYESREEFLEVDVADLYQNPEDREKLSQKLLSDGFVKDEELQLKKKDGTLFTASVSTVAVKDENGEVVYFDGIIEDITERKQILEALREREERYRAVVENSSEVILVAQDGLLRFMNIKAMEITGYSRDELTSKPFTDFIHPDDRDMVIERYIERLRGEELPNTYPLRIINKDGGVKWMEINSALITWDRRPATLSFLTDITERRRAEAEYRSLMEDSGISISAIGVDGEILLLNNMAAMDLGGKPEDFIGKRLYDIFPKNVADRFMERIHHVVSSGEGHVTEGVVVLPSGESRWYWSNVQPIIDSSGRISGVRTISRDIAEQKQAEAREALAYDQGRLEIVDTILHNIGNAISSVTIGIGTIQQYLDPAKNRSKSHFLALANAVKEHKDNFGDYVENDPQGQKVAEFIVALADEFAKHDEQTRETVERVRECAEHIVDITRTTKLLNRRSVYRNRKDRNLEKAIDDAFTVLRGIIDKTRIKLDVNCTDAPEEISIQESQFNQMLLNLIKNSVEAIEDLKIRGGLNGTPTIKIKSYAEADSLIIEVVDNGIGIEKDKLEAIFGSSYTTKKEGSGLGLHSTAIFVNSCGGQIQALSDGIGKGATMRITLPIS